MVAALCLASCQKHEATDVRLEDPLIQLAMAQSSGPSSRAFTGVVSARVHIVIPERRPNETTPAPPSAAIFIKYQDDYDLNAYVPQIKQLVANSVEGLSYDKVSVVLFPSSSRAELPSRPKPSDEFMDRKTLIFVGAGLAVVVLALAGAVAFLLLRRRREAPAAKAA